MKTDDHAEKLAFDHPLPASEDTWEDSPLGPPNRWPDAVQAFSLMISSFVYPAAIFWGEEFVLLHNEQWTQVGPVDQQGQRQRGNLSAHPFNALSSALHGGQPKRISSQALLRCEPEDEAEKYIALISPLFDRERKLQNASGLLAQLLPNQDGLGEEQRELKSAADGGTIGQTGVDSKNQGSSLGISEPDMLPSGLAILDHKAQAVFINQHFYQLTVRIIMGRSFDAV
ncbi:hypothetical protein LTR27_012167 [Elasticomyces elasticus]|nr:hypothetical protein LTR27_012167 [Elasticomyces elasticus]